MDFSTWPLMAAAASPGSMGGAEQANDSKIARIVVIFFKKYPHFL